MSHETFDLEKIKNKKEILPDEITEQSGEEKEDLDLEPLKLEAHRFDEKMASMISRLKELEGLERRSAASNYIHALEKFESATKHELDMVTIDLNHHSLTRVGEFIDTFKYEFGGTSKEESAKQMMDRMRKENIPPVNIPIIVNLLARAGLLEHKLSLIRETKAVVEGYNTVSSREHEKDIAIGAKTKLSKLISLLDRDPELRYGEENLDYEFSLLNELGERLASLGISASYLSKAKELIKTQKRREAKGVLIELDDKLNDIINVK